MKPRIILSEEAIANQARPQAIQRRGVERTEAILDAAEELLAEQGYAAATLKAIGGRARIPTASLYHYFGGRGLSNPMPKTLRDSVDAVIDPLLCGSSSRWEIGLSMSRSIGFHGVMTPRSMMRGAC